MHKSHYQPKRSQQLFLAEEVAKKLDTVDRIIVHHVLEDSSTRLFLQIERHAVYGGKVSFERVEL